VSPVLTFFYRSKYQKGKEELKYYIVLVFLKNRFFEGQFMNTLTRGGELALFGRMNMNEFYVFENNRYRRKV
jgi:hypothetical protein